MKPADISVYRHYIESALEYAGDTHTFDDVTSAVAEGRLQFWPGPHSAVITEIHEYPQYRALNIFLAGGQIGEIERMTPGILEWGRSRGCKIATFTGRRGWERTFLTRTGWEVSELVVMQKEL